MQYQPLEKKIATWKCSLKFVTDCMKNYCSVCFLTTITVPGLFGEMVNTTEHAMDTFYCDIAFYSIVSIILERMSVIMMNQKARKQR